jgi:N-acetylmuramoyl-L-alanine amidase
MARRKRILGKNTDINSASIGIELDNNGSEPFSEAQITSLMALLSKLQKQYGIPAQNIIGHSDIAPTVNQIQVHCSHGNAR